MFGGVAIGAFAWVQYQAARMSERQQYIEHC